MKTTRQLYKELAETKADRDVFEMRMVGAEKQLAKYTGCDSPYVLREVMDAEIRNMHQRYSDDIHRLIQRLR